jgi:site-specific recombinase XerD
LRDGGFARKVASVEKSAFDDVEKDFARYLTQERGLAQATLDNYLPTVRAFLSECFGKGPLALNKIEPQNITRFQQRRIRGDGEAAHPWRGCGDGESLREGNKRPVT